MGHSKRAERRLVVVADDYGMGPATSAGILELAKAGRLSASVLIVNTTSAADAVEAWRQCGQPIELGWHPNLTLDRPTLPADRVPSLVSPTGEFWPLAKFVSRLLLGLIRPADISAELTSQQRRFCELVGHPPTMVNSHQHVALFPPVGRILLDLLKRQKDLPYVRRVQEPWRMLGVIRGAVPKRLLLTVLGRCLSRLQRAGGFPGNDWLAGITNPPHVADPEFFVHWLGRVPGQVVELACHPGHHDPSLVGRDCSATDGQLGRRVREFQLLQRASFPEACRQAGFRLVKPTELILELKRDSRHAA